MSDVKDKEEPPGRTIRALMRRSSQAALATSLVGEGERAAWPYASLVLVGLDHDASPLLLVSDLADHSKNLAADDRLALLFDGTAGYADPLAGSRATVLGRVRPADGEAQLLARYLGRHPGASVYAGFADFHLLKVEVERAHLVAGFGRIHWVEADQVLYDCREAAALAEAEPGIVAHMNEDHGDALALIAKHILGLDAEGWSMTGVDPEGFDLRGPTGTARADFTEAVQDAESCRRALVALTKQARGRAEGTAA